MQWFWIRMNWLEIYSGIQNIGIEYSKVNIIVDKRQVPQIWYNYVTELDVRSNWPENLEVQPEKEVDADQKAIGKAIPIQAWTGPEASRSLRLPDFKTIGTWKW